MYEVISLDKEMHVMARSGFYHLKETAEDVAALVKSVGVPHVFIAEEFAPIDEGFEEFLERSGEDVSKVE